MIQLVQWTVGQVVPGVIALCVECTCALALPSLVRATSLRISYLVRGSTPAYVMAVYRLPYGVVSPGHMSVGRLWE